jgi:hypothetical protein
LRDLSTAFGAIGVRWYWFGAQAAILYGAARLTADVDVTSTAAFSRDRRRDRVVVGNRHALDSVVDWWVRRERVQRPG